MFKLVCVLAISLSSLAAKASQEPFQERFECNVAAGKDVGTITMLGDSTESIFSQITLDGKLMAFRYGITSRDYIYLFEDYVDSRKSYKLEVVNYPKNFNQYTLSVYPPEGNVLRSSRISIYNCARL